MSNEIPKERMTLEELIDHIFSFEEEMYENMYADEVRHVENVNIQDPEKLVEDIEEIFHTVLEIARREIFSRKIYPDFNKDIMAEILRFRKEELKKIEDGTVNFGELVNRIEMKKLTEEIEARTGSE